MYRLPYVLLVVFTLMGNAWAAAPDTPQRLNVVATIKPIHALIAGVMDGIADPQLLIEGGSPHGYALKPSDARALEDAVIIFWVGPEVETFLVAGLKSLGSNAQIIELASIDGLASAATTHDPHIWLDPRYAQRIVRVAADTLAAADPQNAAAYEANATRLIARLGDLEREIFDTLEDVQGVPFIVYHDAYANFEQRFGMPALASVSTGAHHVPSAARIRKLQTLIATAGVACVFAEPQFEPKLIAPLIEGTAARIGVLDPLGAQLSPGPELYFELIRLLANSLKTCLGQPTGSAP